MRRQAAVLALLCAVAVTVAAGCGGSNNSSSDFRKSYNQIVRQYSSLPGEVGNAIRTASRKSDVALATQFSDFADRTSAEVDKLSKLKPPEKAKDEYDTFLATLRRIVDDLRSISAAAKAHDARKAESSVRSLATDATDASSKERALKQAVG